MKKIFLSIYILLILPFSTYATPVDVELSLLVDVSGSVSQAEYALQRDGYKTAFYDADVQAAILNGTLGSIAVNYIEWDSSAVQRIAFTQLNSVSTIESFADSIGVLTDSTSGGTAPGTAINYAMGFFGNNVDNGFEGTRNVIDVSGDGEENTGADTSDARDAALANGIDTINGIAIGGTSLETWYTNNVMGGDNAFVLLATDFNDFSSAIKTKLVSEITGTSPVPEPGTMLLFGVGLLGLAGVSRKKK